MTTSSNGRRTLPTFAKKNCENVKFIIENEPKMHVVVVSPFHSMGHMRDA